MKDVEKTMTIWEHLNELRSHIFKAVIGLTVTTLASFSFAQYVIYWFADPIGGIQNLQSIEVTENVSVFMRVSLLSGFILAFPYILYQLLAFILPGLKPSEKKWIFISIPIITIMFLSGVAFAYFVMLRAALPFLTGFLNIQNIPRLDNYIRFVTSILFWMGISFEAPVLVFFLAKFRLISAKPLAKQWRIAIVVIAVVAAIITPTVDPVNMFILMLPLMVIYLLCIWAAYLGNRG